LPDGQAAHEKTITTILPALAGTNLIYGAGMIESGQTWSHEQLVIDDDIIGMVKRVIQGIDVTDETLAFDVINNIHETKNYLEQKHTLNHMRLQSAPRLFDRNPRKAWETKGGMDLTQKAKGKALRIMKEHRCEPLPEDSRKALKEIIKKVERERLGI